MQITKEIKLKNPERCKGCYNLKKMNKPDNKWYHCLWGHRVLSELTKANKATFFERPESCIKENGE